MDFGADVAFGRIADKLQEHYAISVPSSSARIITEDHGEKINKSRERKTVVPERKGVAQLIVESDGSFIPIVENRVGGEQTTDRRKNKKLGWKEARLCFARRPESLTAIFGATLGGVKEAGDEIANCAIKAGAGQQTKLHCVGDGARWIVEQMERIFGCKASYLVDFYHLSEYVSQAANAFAREDKAEQVNKLHKQLKENRVGEVVEKLAEHLESEEVANEEAPVRACHRYIVNRPGQFNYAEAIKAGLPIGSGEVESGHQWVLQDRMKLAGAWWKEENAEKMMGLRVMRANGEWQSYWQNKSAQAA